MNVLKICGERGLRLVKTKIVLEIKNCIHCPFVRMLEAEYGYNIFCGKASSRLIMEMAEYESDLDAKTPPEWCPCRLEKQNDNS